MVELIFDEEVAETAIVDPVAEAAVVVEAAAIETPPEEEEESSAVVDPGRCCVSGDYRSKVDDEYPESGEGRDVLVPHSLSKEVAAVRSDDEQLTCMHDTASVWRVWCRDN